MREKILDKLRTVLDPELGVSIVDLGLIYNVWIEGATVEIVMTLTTPFCPLSSFLEKEIVSKVKEIKGIKSVKIKLTFDPPWDPSKMSEETRLRLGF